MSITVDDELIKTVLRKKYLECDAVAEILAERGQYTVKQQYVYTVEKTVIGAVFFRLFGESIDNVSETIARAADNLN